MLPQANHSIRTRYISIALILGACVLFGSYYSIQDFQRAYQEISNRMSSVNQILDRVGTLHNAIQEGYRIIDLYLLEPEHNEYIDLFQMQLDLIDEQILLIDSQQRSNPFENALTDLKQKLNYFRTKAYEIFIIRANVAKQYPSIAIANGGMQPPRMAIDSALDTIIAELSDSEGKKAFDPELLHTVLTIKSQWYATISQFRLYLIIRIGSINEDELYRQMRILQDLYDTMEVKVDYLHQLGQEGKLNFVMEDSVETITIALKEWLEQLKQVAEINSSGQWRIDTVIMRQDLLPMLGEMTNLIKILETEINQDDNEVLATFRHLNTQQNWIYLTIIALFFVYIILTILTMERIVFIPIAAVTRALKNAAFGSIDSQSISTKASEIRHLIDAFQQMRQQVIEREEQLTQQATHDSLTHLPNRIMLHDLLEYHIPIAAESGQLLGLMLLDLDRFKEINDTLGHSMGDALLKEISGRFRSCLNHHATLARLGGDEFAILLPNTTLLELSAVARTIINTTLQPINTHSITMSVGVSIGITLFPEPVPNASAEPLPPPAPLNIAAIIEQLLRQTDVAMYAAKRQRCGSLFYHQELDQNSIGRLNLVNDLRQAIELDQLQLYYQPQYDLQSGRLYPIGAEALLRWFHPEQGFIPPDQIVALAEQVNLIDPLTEWVLHQAIKSCRAWELQGHSLHVAINLSVHNLVSGKLCDLLALQLARHQLAPTQVMLEITEGAMMSNPVHSIEILNRIHAMGIELSVDDFGTGFSSLAYLKQLPVTELKIDKSFVMEIESNESAAVIVNSTIDLAHNLGLRVVAEGVENATVAHILTLHGCDLVQGYHYSRPIDGVRFIQLLNQQQESSPL